MFKIKFILLCYLVCILFLHRKSPRSTPELHLFRTLADVPLDSVIGSAFAGSAVVHKVLEIERERESKAEVTVCR